MPPSISTSTSASDNQITTTTTGPSLVQSLLESARPFLRGELEKVDPKLPSLVAVLRSAGAGECWHKHGSFLDHLVDTYRILKLWGAPSAVCLCGLFHSAYSNSYVNLAIFDPSTTGRDDVLRHVGPAAEHLVHLFCIVPRQPLIHDSLIFRYPDPTELAAHLAASQRSLEAVRERGVGASSREEGWREKLNSLVPADGVVVKHIKTGEDIRVSRRVVATFLMMTMADFSDQLFGFQDELFDNSDGRLEFVGNNPQSLWPGDGKPGLWMSSVSKMAAVYTLIAREEEIRAMEEGESKEEDEDDAILKLVIPPVFEGCTRVLHPREQTEARDLYWESVCEYKEIGMDKAGELLVRSIEKNPYVGEPHVVLAQIYVGKGRFEEAEAEAEKGLTLLLQWGSPWDKRMSWEGWVAWARVLLMKSKERSWPQTGWGVLNLGLVR